jgi:molybdopterin-binding protein
MLEVTRLHARIGTFQLADIHLKVEPGTCHVILGPSGSGKSLLLQCLLGLVPIHEGLLTLDGRDITHEPTERRGLGYLPQQPSLFPHLSVRDNLFYSARARRMPLPDVEPLVNQLIEATGIGNLLHRRPATLSGGEAQRVGLVRALASQPRVVLLDEPFTALNENFRKGLWWVLRDLQRSHRLTLLLVTHDLEEAWFLADQVTMIMHGEIAQTGSRDAVFQQPQRLEIARFLGVETLQRGRILEVRDGLATVEVQHCRLLALAPDFPQQDVLVSILSEEITLSAIEDQSARSARNRIQATVRAIHPGKPMMRVDLDGGFPFTASITRSALEELALEPGSQVNAWIKAPSVHLIPMGS